MKKFFKPKLVKDLKFKYNNVTICYAINGHHLYDGPIDKIPEHILNYYCGYKIVNSVRKYTYIEVTEDKDWWGK